MTDNPLELAEDADVFAVAVDDGKIHFMWANNTSNISTEYVCKLDSSSSFAEKFAESVEQAKNAFSEVGDL